MSRKLTKMELWALVCSDVWIDVAYYDRKEDEELSVEDVVNLIAKHGTEAVLQVLFDAVRKDAVLES